MWAWGSQSRVANGRSGEGLWDEPKSCSACGIVQSAVPRREYEILVREHEGGGEVQSVEAAQCAIDRKRGRVFYEALVYLDDAEHGPLRTDRLGGCLAGG